MSRFHNTNCGITSPKYKPSHKSFRGACFVFLFWWKWPVCGAQGQKCCHTWAPPHFPTAYCKGADQNHGGWNHLPTCPLEAGIPQGSVPPLLLCQPNRALKAHPCKPPFSPPSRDDPPNSWELGLLFKHIFTVFSFINFIEVWFYINKTFTNFQCTVQWVLTNIHSHVPTITIMRGTCIERVHCRSPLCSQPPLQAPWLLASCDLFSITIVLSFLELHLYGISLHSLFSCLASFT